MYASSETPTQSYAKSSSPERSDPTPSHDDGTIWDILGFSTKGKGKERDPRSLKTTKGKAPSVPTSPVVDPTKTHASASTPMTGFKATRKARSHASLPKVPSGPVELEKDTLAVGRLR